MLERIFFKMDPKVPAIIDAMQQQQEHFMTALKTLFNSATRSTPGLSTPRFDTFDKSKENWAQYIEKLDQHFVLHNVTDLDKKTSVFTLQSRSGNVQTSSNSVWRVKCIGTNFR